MTWHVYKIVPIDYGWENLLTVEETFQRMVGSAGESWNYETSLDGVFYPNPQQALKDAEALLTNLNRVRELAIKKAGWEGDVRGRIYVFWLPNPELDFSYGFVWKQDNNGDTFVAAQRPIFDPNDNRISEFAVE